MTQFNGAPSPPPPPPGTGIDLHPLSLGRTLQLTLGMLRFRWRLFMMVVLLPMVPAYLVASIVQVPFLQTMNRWLIESDMGGSGLPPVGLMPPPGWAEAALFLTVTGVLLSLVGLVATAAVTHAAGTVYGGRGTGARAAVGRGLRRLPSIAGAYLLYLLALVAIVAVGAVLGLAFVAGGSAGGLLLFAGLVVLVSTVATALFVVVRWSLIMPVLMLEGRGAIEALGRSWQLVAGSGWRVLGYLLLIGILVGLLGAIVLQVGFALLGGSALTVDGAVLLVQGLFSGLVATLLAPILPIALTLLYYDLRWRRGELPAA